MGKRVFIINGSGGVGKDTVCRVAAQFWRVQNVSSITPILSVARAAGWDGNKTPAARRFLSDLKAVCTAFNDLPFRYCVEQWDAFQNSDAEVLFIHIREPDEIERLRRVIGGCCRTILIRRPALEESRGPLGNHSDDEVAGYPYDGILVNDGPLENLPDKVHHFLLTLW